MVWLRRSPKTRNCQREAAPITKCLLLLFYCVASRVAISLTSWSSSPCPRCLRISARQPTRRSFTNAIADSLSHSDTATAPPMQIYYYYYYYFRAPRPPPFDAYTNTCLSGHCNSMPSTAKYYFIMFSLSHHTAAKQQYALSRRWLPSEA